MNEKLLKPILEAIRYLCHVKNWSTHGPADISAEVLADQLTELLIQLRAMLKEPTSEEQKEMLDTLDDMEAEVGVWLESIFEKMPESYIENIPKIRAAIKAKKPTVTMTQVELLVETGKQEGMSPEYLADWLRSIGLEVK